MKFDYIYSYENFKIIPGISFRMRIKTYTWISKFIYYSFFSFNSIRAINCESNKYNSLKMFYEIR